jgi:cytidyltransferase-like protein
MSKKVCVSGYFDPINSAHISLIQQASLLGDVIVILNNDRQIYNKKGFYFVPIKERMRVLLGIKGVHGVAVSIDRDGTVCETLANINPDYFVNGGDRPAQNTPEMEVCNRLGIEFVYVKTSDVHSSDIIKNGIKNIMDIKTYRPWGSWSVIEDNDSYRIKKINVNPKSRLSLQYHGARSESWTIVKGIADVQIGTIADDIHYNTKLHAGESIEIPKGTAHRLENNTKEPLEVIEVQYGKCDEDDIIRLEDDYKRI